MTWFSGIRRQLGIALLLATVVQPAHAYVSFTGTINVLEIWKTGSGAFTLSPTVASFCGGQFVVNASAPGSRNLVATLICRPGCAAGARFWRPIARSA